VPRHDAWIHMGQKTRLGEDELAHAGEVFDRRLATELGELLTRRAVAEFRLVPEREERLVTAGVGAGARDLEHLVRPHVGSLTAPWRLGERAVVADIPAELRQRDEDLRGVSDQRHASIDS